ncbi:MAG: winged helix DNA-binding domain-containing protein, partial [Nocardioidaceae bacterium]|nr:winged helix DNA-binding domain-containing protein [Nocardioidaceae bacterium]
MPSVTRDQVLRFRVHAQQLDRSGSHPDAAALDVGVQDTGPDGAAWALAIRGTA